MTLEEASYGAEGKKGARVTGTSNYNAGERKRQGTSDKNGDWWKCKKEKKRDKENALIGGKVRDREREKRTRIGKTRQLFIRKQRGEKFRKYKAVRSER